MIYKNQYRGKTLKEYMKQIKKDLFLKVFLSKIEKILEKKFKFFLR